MRHCRDLFDKGDGPLSDAECLTAESAEAEDRTDLRDERDMAHAESQIQGERPTRGNTEWTTTVSPSYN